MKARWVQSCSIYLCLVCFLFRYGGRCSEQLPSVLWDPWNPLFRCEDPVIKVKISNLISFVCPVYDLRPYLENYLYANSEIFETLYFVDDNFTAYNTCDATNYVAKKFLNCDGQSRENYRLSFRETSANSLIPDMVKGRTYYFIGTGYRTKANLGQLVGGSCSKTEDGKQGQGKLRLKVYICKDDEPCDLCRTAGCYYKGCTANCSHWAEIGRREGKTGKDCRLIKARNCTNSLLGEEKQEINDTELCPPPSPTPLPTPSPTPSPQPPPSVPGVPGKESDDTKFYIAIGATVLFFFVGIAIGALAFKKYHSRHCCSKASVAHNDGYGHPNLGFDVGDGKKPHQMSQLNGLWNSKLYAAQNGK